MPRPIEISRRMFAQRVLFGTPALLPSMRSVFGPEAQSSADRVRRLAATEPQEIGPYHRDGSPLSSSLCPVGTPGRPLAVTGRVLAEDTGAPLANVLLDVWQADSFGKYDFQDNPQPRSPDQYRMRALRLTDRIGHYGFSTVVPGNYGSSPTTQRAKHIHYLIRRTGYEPLITQLYFEGDPWNKRDPLVRRSLIMPVRDVEGGSAAVTFDIVLRREQLLDAETMRSFGDYLGEYAFDGADHTVLVAWRSGRLVAVLGKDVVHELRHRGGTRFFDLEAAAKLTFVRDEHGQVTQLLVDLDDGRHVRAKRVR